MIKKLITLCLVLSFSVSMYAQKAWQYVGSEGTSNITEITSYIDPIGFKMAISPSGIPYVVFSQGQGIDYQTKVLKLDGTTWIPIGDFSGQGKFAPSDIAISPSGIPYVVFTNFGSDTQENKVMSFNGSTWVNVGGTHIDPGPGWIFNDMATGWRSDIEFDNSGTLYVAYQDQNLKCTVRRFNGSTWDAVGSVGIGNAQPGTNSYNLVISPSGTPYLLYCDGTNNYKATVKKFDGTSWVTMGNPSISIGNAGLPDIVVSSFGTPYISYSDNSQITVKSFDGTNWVLVGSSNIGTGNTPKLAFNSSGTLHVAYLGTGNPVLRFNGSNWDVVGSTGFSYGASVLENLIFNPASGEPWVTYVANGIAPSYTIKIYAQKYANIVCASISSQSPIGNVGFDEGNNTSFKVIATGSNVDYKWKRNGSYIPGAISSTYSVPNITIADAGVYVCEVSNLCGAPLISQPITLSVNIAPQYKISAWGCNYYGTAVPTGLIGAKAIGAGISHGAALKQDGTVAVWGSNEHGMLDIPAGLTGVKAISVQGFQTLALKNDGTVVQWGGTLANVPAGLSGVTAVAAGFVFAVALKSDGTVVAWGNDSYGQVSGAVGKTNIKAIAAGSYHVVALKNDGSIVAWGDNSAGQVSGANGVTGVKSISAGESSTYLLMQDGTTRQFGINISGVSSATNLKSIVSNSYHALAIGKNDVLSGYGANACGQLNIPSGLANIKAAAVGGQGDGSFNVGPYSPFSVVLYVVNLMFGGGSHCSGSTPPPVYINLVGLAPWSVSYTEDGVTKTVTNIMYSPYTVPLAANNAISHTYQLTSVTDGNGTKAVNSSVTTTPIVTPLPLITSQSPAGGNISICSITPYTLSIVATGATSYQWRKDGAYISGATSNSYAFSNPLPSNSGTYDCIAFAACSVQVASSQVVLTVKQNPTTATPSDNWNGTTNRTALNATSDAQSAVSDWYYGGGYHKYAGQSTAIGGAAYLLGSGYNKNFKVVTYAPGCSTFAIINYYTGVDTNPGRKELNELDGIGIQSYLYPNPATSSFYINSYSDKFSIRIFNTLGEELLSKEYLRGEMIDVSSLYNGIYTIKVKDGDDTFVKKLDIIK